MKPSIKKKVLSLFNWLAILLFPIAHYFYIIYLNPLNPLQRILNDRSILGFLLIFLLYGLCFNIKGKPGWFLGLSTTAILFSVPLANMLHSGFSDAAVLGSFLPYKDGFYYYNGAQTLLIGRLISFGWNDVFRPLFPGILAFFLFITNNNLLFSLSLMILGMGFGCYLASRQIKVMLGNWPAALFMALITMYSRRFIGYTWSEIPGVFLGCIAFILLAEGAKNRKLIDLSLGAIMLVLALSVRAGAFIILPLIALWVGFSFPNSGKFNLKSFVVVTVLMLGAFILANQVVPGMLTSPESATFGNFAYTLYGQAKGGADWYQAIEEFQTDDTAYIMQEAINLILRYPRGIIIGSIKAYRDFFAPANDGIFNLIVEKSPAINIVFWASNAGLLILGIIFSIRSFRKPFFSLLIICLAGLILSIPFVPPISNGNRLYAGSIPFLFALSVAGLAMLLTKNKPGQKELEIDEEGLNLNARGLSIILICLVLISPILINAFGKAPDYQKVNCPEPQISFAMQISHGSFIDVSNRNNANCGGLYQLCLSDFENNGADKQNDAFFRILVEKAASSKNGIRITESVDLLTSKYNFFVGPSDLLASDYPKKLVMGCALKIEHENQQALWVVSVQD